MVELVYSGNFFKAVSIMNTVWDEGIYINNDSVANWNREKYLEELVKKLESSQFFQNWMLER